MSSSTERRMIPDNVRSVASLSLWNERAKSIRASYKRHWEVLMDVKPRKWEWESQEGDGDEVSKQDNLMRYIESHIPLIDKHRNQIRLSDKASMRWASGNRSGGSRHRAWKAFNAAIEPELLCRGRQAEPVEQGSAQAHVEVRYLLQYAFANQRIQRDLLADDLNTKKPTVKGKLKLQSLWRTLRTIRMRLSDHQIAWKRNWRSSN